MKLTASLAAIALSVFALPAAAFPGGIFTRAPAGPAIDCARCHKEAPPAAGVAAVLPGPAPTVTVDGLAQLVAGTASVFTGKSDGFGVEMEYKGTVTVTIDGKPYSGDFAEEPEKKK